MCFAYAVLPQLSSFKLQTHEAKINFVMGGSAWRLLTTPCRVGSYLQKSASENILKKERKPKNGHAMIFHNTVLVPSRSNPHHNFIWRISRIELIIEEGITS